MTALLFLGASLRAEVSSEDYWGLHQALHAKPSDLRLQQQQFFQPGHQPLVLSARLLQHAVLALGWEHPHQAGRGDPPQPAAPAGLQPRSAQLRSGQSDCTGWGWAALWSRVSWWGSSGLCCPCLQVLSGGPAAWSGDRGAATPGEADLRAAPHTWLRLHQEEDVCSGASPTYGADHGLHQRSWLCHHGPCQTTVR